MYVVHGWAPVFNIAFVAMRSRVASVIGLLPVPRFDFFCAASSAFMYLRKNLQGEIKNSRPKSSPSRGQATPVVPTPPNTRGEEQSRSGRERGTSPRPHLVEHYILLDTWGGRSLRSRI